MFKVGDRVRVDDMLDVYKITVIDGCNPPCVNGISSDNKYMRPGTTARDIKLVNDVIICRQK